MAGDGEPGPQVGGALCADLVAVGTESFRDPLAAIAIAAELTALEHNFPANSGVRAAHERTAAAPIAH